MLLATYMPPLALRLSCRKLRKPKNAETKATLFESVGISIEALGRSKPEPLRLGFGRLPPLSAHEAFFVLVVRGSGRVKSQLATQAGVTALWLQSSSNEVPM